MVMMWFFRAQWGILYSLSNLRVGTGSSFQQSPVTWIFLAWLEQVILVTCQGVCEWSTDVPSVAEISLTPSPALLLLPFHLMFPFPNSHPFVRPFPISRSLSVGSGLILGSLGLHRKWPQLLHPDCNNVVHEITVDYLSKHLAVGVRCEGVAQPPAETAGVRMCRAGLDSPSRRVNNNESYWRVWTETMRFSADVDVIFASWKKRPGS